MIILLVNRIITLTKLYQTQKETIYSGQWPALWINLNILSLRFLCKIYFLKINALKCLGCGFSVKSIPWRLILNLLLISVVYSCKRKRDLSKVMKHSEVGSTSKHFDVGSTSVIAMQQAEKILETLPGGFPSFPKLMQSSNHVTKSFCQACLVCLIFYESCM